MPKIKSAAPSGKFKIIICPSGDEENDPKLEKADTYRKVKNLMKRGPLTSLSEFEFATHEERQAFIDGYEAGVGWLGDGFYITSESDRV